MICYLWYPFTVSFSIVPLDNLGLSITAGPSTVKQSAHSPNFRSCFVQLMQQCDGAIPADVSLQMNIEMFLVFLRFLMNCMAKISACTLVKYLLPAFGLDIPEHNTFFPLKT